MDNAVLTTIAATGFGVAFFHAAVPTHWLPFVLTARVQRWSHAQTLAVTALAGSGHVLFTALLGVGITWLGLRLSVSAGAWFARAAATILFAAAIFYAVRQFRGHAHHHEHSHHSTDRRVSNRAAVWSLFAFLTVSPCEAFLPIYASGIRYGWFGFAVLTTILSLGTVIGMIAFTAASLAGLSRLRLHWIEHYESGIIATLLALVGVFVLVLEH
jgi:hypothetical protein